MFRKRAIYIVFTLQLLRVQLYLILRNIYLRNVGHAQLKVKHAEFFLVGKKM